ncbi:MAG TPA: translation elongation factor Ts [Myxococcaceae bacterium]|nr:translation elongation factor Ts [Myxococcaceae bacterium]
MAEVTAQMVKELREQTGAGLMDCKKALSESDGDFTKAQEWLRKKGISRQAGKAGRVAAEGLVGSYIHNGKVGVMVEINCETDFVARNPDFQDLVKEVAMHIAAAAPKYVSREEVPEAEIAKEKEVHMAQLRDQKKPENILEKIVQGKIDKFFETICLVDQYWVKDDKKRIGDLVSETGAKIGEKIAVRRFVRFEVGEGIEKKSEDFAAEVAKSMSV